MLNETASFSELMSEQTIAQSRGQIHPTQKRHHVKNDAVRLACDKVESSEWQNDI
jgi:hypothetical protein